MKKHLLRVTTGLMALVMLFGCTACRKPAETPVSTENTTAATTVATTAPASGAPNLLTGEKLTGNNDRPVACMIDNFSSKVRQKNIDKADFYLEAETEGGISRIMAVFGSVDSLPDEIGPMRSARTHFVKMVKALDAIYCHVGGSTMADELIPALGVTDLSGGLPEVSNELKVNGATEHTKVFKKNKMLGVIASKKIATTTATKSPYVFGNKSGDGAGNTVQVNTSSSWKTSFTYDAATGLYTKHRTTPTSDPHVSYDGDPIQVRNVIVMYDERFKEDAKHISFTLDSGEGVLVTGGTSRSIKWKRTNDQLTFTETDGTALTVATGKTYVLLTSTALASKTILK